ncbi:aldehyde dehydrogenase family protein [Pseudonocardia xishanensis]|uniref:Aldehyde dehydrogenase n=1 Tax=Pseudonocardia xishanensis TaxID=630995 RepID=A0ABP8RRV0_9PSEU
MTSVLSGEAASGVEGVPEVVARLRRTFAGGRTRSLEWRLEQLAGIERLVVEREAEIAAALAEDQGRSAHYAWLGEVAPTVAEAAFARRNLKKWMRTRRTGLPLTMLPGRAEYRYEPLGVVLVIGPWNYPVYLTLSPLVAAVSAGNCAVLKPSEHTPETSALLARLVPQYLDPAAVAVVEGAADATQALLAQAMDHVLFTGGPEIGKRVLEGAAPHLTPVTLELGGKSPAVVTADADIEVAARRIAWMKLLNSGQTCIAPDYALVDVAVRDEFLAALQRTIEEFQVGEPAGRVIDERQFDRVSRLLGSHGGTVVRGGAEDRESLKIDPVVVLDPSPDSPLMQEEIFGPVLPVVTVSSLDEAIRRINSGPKPLAAYLFGSSKTDRERLIDETSSGGVVINHAAMHCLVPQLPFGGVGNSGMGAYHGRWGFETFSHRKAVLVKPAKPDPSVMYPPYTESKKKLMRRFF